ncbi:retrovirus-related pol polyprotein from transposon TNT 1-94 [Tanacetum coccineum]
MMSFLTAVVTSRYPTTNNQLRNSSNPRQQATINNGRVTLQPIQGRQTSFVVGTSRTYTPGASGSNSGKQRTAVEQHRIELKTFEVKMNQVLNENERLLEQVMSKDIVNLLVNPSVENDSCYVHKNVKSQEKDTVIKKLKERIKSLSGKMDKDKIKQDLEEIETINIELDHREKALAITTLKDELRKLKGKSLVDNNVSNHPSDPELHQVNVEPITPKLLNKRTAHSAYIKHSQEEAVVLRDLVDHIKANYPLDPLLESTLKQSTSASGSQPSGNTKKDKIQQTPSSTLKNKVEAHPRKVKSSLKNKDCVVAPKGTAHVQHSKLNANYELKCVKCNGCMLSDNHDLCVLDFINNVNARAKSRSVKKNSKRKVWKPTGKVFTNIGYIWRPTVDQNSSPINLDSPVCSKHMDREIALISPTSVSKYLGRGYYVQDLGISNLGGTIIDSNLEVAFCQHTCYIRNLEGVDLLTGSRGDNLYTISLGDIMTSSPICLLLKASKTKSWLWHRLLSHLNFDAINHLARHSLVRGLPKLKFEKDHLCSVCALGKSTKKPHKPKSEDTNQEKLYLLHMDLCGPMRVAHINGKKYILVIVDDYSRFIWVKCLRSKDEALAFIINFLKMIQVRLNENLRTLRKQLMELIDQDAPSPSNSQTTPETKPPVIPNDVEEDNHDIEVAHMGNDLYFGVLILEIPSDQSSSSDSINTIVHPDHQISEHNSKWTKDHPLENIIGELARPVSTRLQLHEQALFCYYNAFLTAVEPKTYKDALTQACWIEAMQEELNEFERLEVWELVPRPDKVMVITLKWIYKVKLDELGGILKKKARLVAVVTAKMRESI